LSKETKVDNGGFDCEQMVDTPMFGGTE